jgi:hypothetical protein
MKPHKMFFLQTFGITSDYSTLHINIKCDIQFLTSEPKTRIFSKGQLSDHLLTNLGLCRIRGSHIGSYGEYYLLGYNAI